MDKILSIIIPSYNMEKYLDKCLDSLLIHSLDNIEILVVNDGSKDRTLEIARDYEGKYPNSIHVIDKPNGNYGSCINRGLKEATGKYIKILDADDSFDTINFELFVKFLQNSDADLILSNFYQVDPDGVKIKDKNYHLSPGTQLTMHEVEKALIETDAHMHAFTYHRNIFSRFKYEQTEGISYTDTEWIFLPLHYVCTVDFFDKPVYRYLVGRDGQTMEAAAFLRNIHNLIKIAKRLIVFDSNFTSEENLPLFYRTFLLRRLKMIYSTCLLSGYPDKNEELKDFHKFVESNASSFIPALYEIKVNILPLLSLCYIRYWANNAQSPALLPLRFRMLTKRIFR